MQSDALGAVKFEMGQNARRYVVWCEDDWAVGSGNAGAGNGFCGQRERSLLPTLPSLILLPFLPLRYRESIGGLEGAYRGRCYKNWNI